jgi:hypothetical protein
MIKVKVAICFPENMFAGTLSLSLSLSLSLALR